MRPRETWLVFGLCLAVLLAAMGLASWTALRLDRAEAAARRQAAVEEDVRLALWRMESALAPFLAREGARPYFAYTAFYPAERAYNRMYNELEYGEVLVPSPLLAEAPPWVLLHFQFGPDGALTSPQVPVGNMRDLAETGYTTHEAIEKSARRLATLSEQVSRAALVAALPPESAAPASQPAGVQVLRPQAEVNAPVINQPAGQQGQPAPQPQAAQGAQQPRPRGDRQSAQEQVQRNTVEWGQRLRYQWDVQQKRAGQAANVQEGGMRPVWFGDSLLLARRVTVSGREYLQGAWLDWPEIRRGLLAEIADLLPGADLRPALRGAEAEPGRLLAAIPARLLPGAVAGGRSEPMSPMVLSLVIAWACVLLAGAAVGALLRGALVLSERRGAFVSAVTHELRTPLTTFKMYTEMLQGGMVADDEKRRQYLATLGAEADRLGHLVENVLAYARLERGRGRSQPATMPLGALIDEVKGRLVDRAERAQMELVVEMAEADRRARVKADASVVEQILLNLVDNACKYAGRAADRRIHLRASAGAASASIRVTDGGPGITREDAGRLFRPFSKSATEAANSAPGVGLGLALSRRLARDLGGDLQYEPTGASGASFVLTLPQ